MVSVVGGCSFTWCLVHYQWYGSERPDDPVKLTNTLKNTCSYHLFNNIFVMNGLSQPFEKEIGDNKGIFISP